MKKVLLGTTGLIAAGAIAGAAMVATPAAAQMSSAVATGGALNVGLSGRHDFTYNYSDRDFTGLEREHRMLSDIRLQLNADGVGDATGIVYGYRSRLRTSSAADTAGSIVFDRNWVFFRGGFGEVQLGNQVSVIETLGIIGSSFSAAGSGGIDGFGRGVRDVRIANSGNSTKAAYLTPNIMGFQAGVDYAIRDGDIGRVARPAGGSRHEDPFAVAANWRGSFGDIGLGIAGGYTGSGGSPTSTDDRSSYQFGGYVQAFGFTADVGFGEEKKGSDTGRTNFINAGVGAEFGGVKFAFTFQNDNLSGASAEQAYYLSANTALLPGVSIHGDVGYIDGDGDGVDFILQLRTAF